MDIIPIQASSVPCERVFSSGKATMAPRRSRISPKLMEALQILKFSIRKGRPLMFTEGMSWKEEIKEFELKALTAPLGDAEAYGRSLQESDNDSDGLMDKVDKLGDEFEKLEKELISELEESGVEEGDDDGDDDDIYA
jgi:hypothetical protein